MMKGMFFFISVFLGSFFTATATNAATEVRYDLFDLGLGRWQYTYEVMNVGLAVPIEEFTIWFDHELYKSVAIETPGPLASDWDEIIWQPNPGLNDDGGYDAFALDLGIGAGESVYGFAVSFDWLGPGQPGSQSYDMIDPIDFSAVDSGFTIPEPLTFVMLSLGGAMTAMLRKRK
jgi:hypothetical protein